MISEARTAKIRELNDQLRTKGLGGTIVAAGSLAVASDLHKAIACTLVRFFNEFEEGDNPYHEHDFGKVHSKALNQDFYFKIDYYAPDMMNGSEDPADPDKTVRVLTIFYAEDY